MKTARAPDRRDGDEAGMILLNVLLFVAIAAGVVALMIGREDAGLSAAARMRDAARADAILRGAELSAITALRRDGLDAPDSDNAAEPWARIGERAVAIPGGRFTLVVADAAGRFNVNAVASGDGQAIALFDRMAGATGIPIAQAVRAREALRVLGPIGDMALAADLADPAVAARLAPLVTALPVPTTINLNAADGALLALLTGDATASARLIARRDRQGFVTAEDFAREGLVVPPGAGFTSDLYWVRARVAIGAASRQQTSLLRRRRDALGQVTVVPVARWLGPRAPLQAPALP